jgi:RNA polymerase primary sigma factor
MTESEDSMKLATRKTTKKNSGNRTGVQPRKRVSRTRTTAVKARNSRTQKEWQATGSSSLSENVTVHREVTLEPKARDMQPTRSSFALYLREIAEENLLSIQEEAELAGLIKKGDESARERMIRANLRLVVKIARDYEGFGLPLLDLINEGNIGLMKAVDKFDPTKGAKFSTYSSWWIKQAIKRSLSNQSKTIRLPIHLVEKIAKLRNVAMRLQEALGREPTDEEIASELEIAPSRVALMRRASTRPVSLDDTVGDDDSTRLEERVADENADHPYEELELQTSLNLLTQLLSKLNPRESRILRYRFGLDGEKERTLEEVGQEFGVTRERIRQLQNIALHRLKRMMDKQNAPVIFPMDHAREREQVSA